MLKRLRRRRMSLGKGEREQSKAKNVWRENKMERHKVRLKYSLGGFLRHQRILLLVLIAIF